jgi:hypothetical protein
MRTQIAGVPTRDTFQTDRKRLHERGLRVIFRRCARESEAEKGCTFYRRPSLDKGCGASFLGVVLFLLMFRSLDAAVPTGYKPNRFNGPACNNFTGEQSSLLAFMFLDVVEQLPTYFNICRVLACVHARVCLSACLPNMSPSY